MQDEPEQHKRQWFGMSIPAVVWNHPELNCTEKCLYAEIHAIGGYKGECFASNEYLGNTVGIEEHQASKMVSKLIRLGMVKVVKFDGRRRWLQTLFDKRIEPGQKSPGSLDKKVMLVGNSKVTPFSRNFPIPKNNTRATARVAGDVDAEGFGIKKEDKLYEACEQFRHFSEEYHGTKFTNYIVHHDWITKAESLIQGPLKGDRSHFLKVLNWYIQNIDTIKFVPMCTSLILFCKAFRQIEKQWRGQSETTGPRVTTTTINSKEEI